jgi:hypothetical protein
MKLTEYRSNGYSGRRVEYIEDVQDIQNIEWLKEQSRSVFFREQPNISVHNNLVYLEGWVFGVIEP